MDKHGNSVCISCIVTYCTPCTFSQATTSAFLKLSVTRWDERGSNKSSFLSLRSAPDCTELSGQRCAQPFASFAVPRPRMLPGGSCSKHADYSNAGHHHMNKQKSQGSENIGIKVCSSSLSLTSDVPKTHGVHWTCTCCTVPQPRKAAPQRGHCTECRHASTPAPEKF